MRSVCRLALFVLVGCAGSGLSSDARPIVGPSLPQPVNVPEHVVVGGDRGGDVTTLPTGTEPTEPQPVPVDEACYPGQDETWSTCLPLVELVPLPSDYVYPAPLGGSVQYTEPALFLDLTTADPALKLAPNFQLDELAQEWKGDYAVVQPHAIESIQAVRDVLGPLVVNSGYRSPGYNAGISGSASSSRHMYGDGFDLDPVSATLDDLHDECWAQGAGYVGVYTTHIHCDWRDDPVDPYFFGLATASILADTLAPAPVHAAEIVDQAGVLSAPAEGWDEGEPLRRWWAWDANGDLVAYEESETFLPPADAVEVIVNVGLELEVGIAF